MPQTSTSVTTLPERAAPKRFVEKFYQTKKQKQLEPDFAVSQMWLGLMMHPSLWCYPCFAGIKVYSNEAFCVPVPLGKHFSPLPCKHVCIPPPCFPAVVSMVTWAPALLTLVTLVRICWFKAGGFHRITQSAVANLWRRLIKAAQDGEEVQRDLPKADLGTGLGLLKQQLRWYGRGGVLRARHRSPVNKGNKQGEIQSSVFDGEARRRRILLVVTSPEWVRFHLVFSLSLYFLLGEAGLVLWSDLSGAPGKIPSEVHRRVIREVRFSVRRGKNSSYIQTAITHIYERKRCTFEYFANIPSDCATVVPHSCHCASFQHWLASLP